MVELYSELKGWQTAVGSLLGFVALLLGAMYNFRLNRKRDRLVREEETASIAAAVYAELLVLREHIGRAANGVAGRHESSGFGRFGGTEPFGESFREGFPLPPAQVYSSLMGKIGLLPPKALLATVQFHENYSQFSYWLPKLEEKTDRGFSFGVLYALDPALKAFEALDIALPILGELASVNGAWPAFDISKFKSVAAFEQEMWEDMREQQNSSK